MTNPFDFSTGQVLTAAQLNQIGDYDSWSPTLTNVTLGNGTVNAHYAVVNEIVHFEIEFQVGSTTSFSSTSMQFSLPSDAQYGGGMQYAIAGGGWAFPTGSSIWSIQTVVIQSTNRVVPYAMISNGTYTQPAAVRNTIPDTWNSSGKMFMSGTYRGA